MTQNGTDEAPAVIERLCAYYECPSPVTVEVSWVGQGDRPWIWFCDAHRPEFTQSRLAAP